MFRVKICGITSAGDAHLAVEAGADAIGLNFYSASPRFCGIETAREIASVLPEQICKVGVFVNAAPAEIRQIVRQVCLDAVQLHGDETPELLGELRPLAIIKVFRGRDDFSVASEYLNECHRRMCLPRMLLLDALSARHYGGTGETVNWEAVARHRASFHGMPFVLAGGLNPSNVEQAIAVVRPWGVDTASGVETSPGRKSPELVRAFVLQARAALAAAARAR